MYPRAERYFALALLVAAVGFFPSYFGRFSSASAIHHFHGLSATAWLLCLVAQAWLMRTRRLRLHRWLGWSSVVLAACLFSSGLLVVHAMLASKGNFSKTFGPRLSFLDVTTLSWFLIAYVLALVYRRRVQLHARFMASTAILVLPPALARLLLFYVPGFSAFPVAVQGGLVLAELATVLLLWDDHRRGGLSKPYLALLAVLLIQHAGFVFVPDWPAWNAFAAWYGTL